MSNIFSRLRVALRLARRDLAAHKIRTVVALLLFALPVSLVVGFVSMTMGYDRSHMNSPVNDVGTVSFPREPGDPVTSDTVTAQSADLSAALGDLADSLSPGVLQTSHFTRDGRSADLSIITVDSSVNGSGPAVEPGNIFLTDQAAFLMGADDGDTVTVDGAQLTVTVGADYQGSVASAQDVPTNRTAVNVTWYLPADRSQADTITDAVRDSGDESVSKANVFTPGYSGSTLSNPTDALTVIGVGTLGILLISAVITPIFAVSARRQRHAMGLLSATGAAPRDLRLVMFSEGLVTGVLGTVIGLVLSTGVSAGLTALVPGADFYWSWPTAAVISVIALICGITSSLLPALRTGREDPVQALADGSSVRMTSFRKRMLIGLVFLVPGIALTTTTEEGSFVLGVSLCGIGVVLSSALVVWLMSRLSTILPTSARLGVRDSRRNSHRTVPAVAAIAGATFLATVVLTLPYNSTTETRYRDNVAVLSGSQGGEEASYSSEIEQTSERMDARSHHTVADVDTVSRGSSTYHATLARSPEVEDYVYTNEWAELRVTDGGLFVAFKGTEDKDIRSASDALAAGKAVVSDPRLIKDGILTVELRESDPYYGYLRDADAPADETLSLPAVVVPGLAGTGAIDGAAISPDTAAALGLETRYVGTAFILDSPATVSQAALTAMGVWPVNSQFATVDTPSVDGVRALSVTIPVVLSWALTLGTVLLVILLAAAESRRDSATITAVGAPPGLLRRYSAAQAVFIALPGTAIGVLVGLLPRVSQTARDLLQNSLFYSGFLTPSQWLALGLTAVVGPVLAWIAGSAIGAVTSRDRSPVRRR